ncbi:arginyltransferase [Reinekea thalattae]|uniref:Aspartate/glutamate leucyltransferase n=1 Tax=Reinekea thalattae TaxID=2593301 RepID=A0A5C8Z885_9GAMM|nr:arginyltransferase [Reinekea thalattae]TXR53458.1 arginyltransferase [Reinekea thalattae]
MKSNSTTDPLIKFFRTGEHECSYLPDQQARTLFLDPELSYSQTLYEELTHAGFRRSGKHLYRPDCMSCQSCIASRIPVDDFQLNRRFRRIMKRNQDVRIELRPCHFDEADYRLFERYVNERHADGDMYPANEANYRDFLTVDRDFSFQVRYLVDDQLIGIGVTDRLNTGLSAIYTFFDPDQASRSLGTYSILKQIELCKEFKLPYLYLGYWIPNCRKMEYKAHYQPIELLLSGRWQGVEFKPKKPSDA